MKQTVTVILFYILCIHYASGKTLDMWEIIERGDKERAQKNLTIDGAMSGERVVQSDIAINSEDEKAKKDLLDKRQSSLPLFSNWHLKLWRTREIPYIIDGSIPDNSGTQYKNCHKELSDAMSYISEKVCLTFRAYQPSDKNWIKFYKNAGCYSGIGRKYWDTTSTDISIGDYCCTGSIIIHEILHALGFHHEQSRRDRDSYVKTYNENIQSSMSSNFDMTEVGGANYEGTEYDPRSIMQYGRNAFRKSVDVVTTEYKFDNNLPLGNTELSPTDIIELNRHYHCDVSSGWSQWSDMGPCIQQTWGDRYCTRGKVRICMGTGTCSGQNSYGVQENVEDCKASSSLSSSCVYPTEDGHWSNWGTYSKCFSTNNCGLGIRTRERTCTNPAPKNGGKTCVGNFIQKEICRNPKCSGYESNVDLTFDSGFGNWISNGFQRRSSQGPYNNVGPAEDVLGTGYYGVFSAPTSTYAQKGTLTSPLINKHPDSEFCFIVHYELNGRKYPSQSFSIYIEHYKSDGSKSYTNLLSLSGHQGNNWIRRGFTIKETSEDYKIVIEAHAYGQENEVSVDNIFLDAGICYPYVNDNSKDYHASCQNYAASGHCSDQYRLWMGRNCEGSCSECKDRHDKCSKWASEKECINNAFWMLWNCCKSCHDVCSNEGDAICRDNASYAAKCLEWAEKGECTTNKAWMSNNCYKSCYEVLRN